MTVYNLKSGFQNILRPTAYRLERFGITPNQITVAACLWSFFYSIGVFFFGNIGLYYFLFPVVFFVRMAMNAIDGIIAKEKNKTSKLGAVLNEICDILSDVFLAAVFIFVSGINSHLVWGFAFLSLFVECAGMWAYFVRGQRSYAGPLGKSDRGFALGIMAYATGFGIVTNQPVDTFINGILIVALILLVVTALNRVRFAIQD